MPKLDLDADNVRVVDLALNAVRDDLLELDLPEDLSLALDEAQGYVFTGAGDEAYVVIRIKTPL